MLTKYEISLIFTIDKEIEDDDNRNQARRNKLNYSNS